MRIIIFLLLTQAALFSTKSMSTIKKALFLRRAYSSDFSETSSLDSQSPNDFSLQRRMSLSLLSSRATTPSNYFVFSAEEAKEQDKTLGIFFNSAMDWIVYFLKEGKSDRFFLQKVIKVSVLLKKINHNLFDLGINQLVAESSIFDRKKLAINFIKFIEEFNYEQAITFCETNNTKFSFFSTKIESELVINSQMFLNEVYPIVFKYIIINLITDNLELEKQFYELLFSVKSSSEEHSTQKFIKTFINHYLFGKGFEEFIFEDLKSFLNEPTKLISCEEAYSSMGLNSLISCCHNAWIKAFKDAQKYLEH